MRQACATRWAGWASGVRGAAAYLGFTFLIVAVMVAFVAAGQVSAARSEEAAGRVEHLLVRRVSRLRWLYGRWLLAVVVLVAAGLAAGILAWAAAASQGGRGRGVCWRRGSTWWRPPCASSASASPPSASPPASTARRLRVTGVVTGGRGGGRSPRLEPLAARHLGVPPDGAGAGCGAGLDEHRCHGRRGDGRRSPSVPLPSLAVTSQASEARRRCAGVDAVPTRREPLSSPGRPAMLGP